MYIQPNTTVRLLKGVPLNNDYVNTLYFENITAQTNHFLSYTSVPFGTQTYQRVNRNRIRLQVLADNIYDYNYMMFQNTAYGNKWFYAFITEITYINDATTEISYEIDVMQSWLFNYIFKDSFIEREHVDNDTVGLHTIPEQVELGEYRCNKMIPLKAFTSVGNIIIGATIDLNAQDYERADDIGGTLNGGLFTGVKYYQVNDNEVNAIITNLAKAGRSNALVAMFMAVPGIGEFAVPEGGVYAELKESLIADRFTWSSKAQSLDPQLRQEQIYKPTTVGGRVPHNNKLLTFPYVYLNMSNNAGGNAIYMYEKFGLFTDELCDFEISGVVSPSYSVRLIPANYNGASLNNDEGLGLGKYPICNWNTDVYRNWITQNGINIATNILTGLGSSFLGIAGAMQPIEKEHVKGAVSTNVKKENKDIIESPDISGGSAFLSGISLIGNSVGELYKHALIPPQVEGNINNGNVNYSRGMLTFTAYQMEIKYEYALMIDQYFDMFGYKINRVKKPNVNHRNKYWYTKTIEANIVGSIPHTHLSIIKSCYNNGITFWKNASEVGDYSVDNHIVERSSTDE